MTPKNMTAAQFTRFCKLHGACKEGLEWIKGKSLDEFWRTSTRGDWMEWLLYKWGYAWTTLAWLAYYEATAPAWRAYNEATATGRTVCADNEAKATAFLAYEEATAAAL